MIHCFNEYRNLVTWNTKGIIEQLASTIPANSVDPKCSYSNKLSSEWKFGIAVCRAYWGGASCLPGRTKFLLFPSGHFWQFTKSKIFTRKILMVFPVRATITNASLQMSSRFTSNGRLYDLYQFPGFLRSKQEKLQENRILKENVWNSPF